MQGWECPKCHAVMAPHVPKCVNCSGTPAPAPPPPTIPPRPPGTPYPWPRPYGPVWSSDCHGFEPPGGLGDIVDALFHRT